MSYENLAEQHADMLATAYDLKIEVPEELRGDTVDDSVIGALDKLIKEKVVTTEKVKKAPAKKAKAAPKKAKAKKAAPKKATVKAKPKKNGYDENLKINWLGKDNPARKGSGRYERIENIKKHNSKTIKTFLTSKGSKRGSLTWCVANGLIKVAA